MWLDVIINLVVRSFAYFTLGAICGGVFGMCLGLPTGFVDTFLLPGKFRFGSILAIAITSCGAGGALISGALYAAVSFFLPAEDHLKFFHPSWKRFALGTAGGLASTLMLLVAVVVNSPAALGARPGWTLLIVQWTGMTAGGILGLAVSWIQRCHEQ